jgi:hypothetical protein
MHRRALNAFFLKVHPDFFVANRQLQKVNENGIAQLNELLDWAAAFKKGVAKPPPALKMSFVFFKKAETEQDTPQKLEAQFSLPAPFSSSVQSEASATTAERAVNRLVRDLLRAAGCITAEEAKLSQAHEVGTTEEMRPRSRELIRNTSPRAKQRPPPRTLAEEAQDSLSQTVSTVYVPTVQELMEADQVLMARSLSPLQTAVALQTLTENLSRMNYAQWHLTPLIIGESYALVEEGLTGGALGVPWNFTVPGFLSLLHENEEKLLALRKRLESFSQALESRIATLCKRLNMDDVLVSCSHEEANRVVELLVEHSDVLQVHDLCGTAVEIGDRWGFRKNGVVLVSKAATSETLESFARGMTARMPALRTAFDRTRSTLDLIAWHHTECMKILQPATIDVSLEGSTYVERLAFLKELYSVAPSLARYSWEGVAIVMGRSLSISWEQNIVVLPPHFAGEAFEKYLEDVRSSADQKSSAALQDYELYKKAKAHDEYMVQTRTDEALTVERPLAPPPDVIFESDLDMKEQLLWEGFHHKPYQGVPLKTESDNEARRFVTNEKFSTEAAMAILKRYREQAMGKAGRDFRKGTLGYVAGFTDHVKHHPGGFPTIARGTKTVD